MSSCLDFNIYRDPDSLGFCLQVMQRKTSSDEAYIASPAVFKLYKHGEKTDGPLLVLSQEEMVGLFNTLLKHGFKPTNTDDKTGQIEALKNHLQDMRFFAYKLLKLKG